ncbi:MAG: hypothetical protein ACI39R_02485 [Lachnospiraceae bacterium]
MIKKAVKVILPVLVVMLITDWVIGVKKVNAKSYIPTQYVELNESFLNGDISFTAKGVGLYNNDEFAEAFGIDMVNSVNGGDLYIVAEFSIKNESGFDVDLSYLLGDVGWGFESHTWCSSADPFTGAMINTYSSSTVKNGEEIRFLLLTGISEISFSKQGWDRIYDTEFYYTLSIYPEPVKFVLGKPGKGTMSR